METLINLLPLLLLVAAMFVFMRFSIRRSAANMDRALSSNDEIVRATNAVVAEFREIKEILRDRN